MVVCPNCKSPNLAENGWCSESKLYLCKECGFKLSLEAKTFASRILKIRQILDITREELGNHLDVASNTVRVWESGKMKKARDSTMWLIENMERQIAQNEVVLIHKRKNRNGPRFKT